MKKLSKKEQKTIKGGQLVTSCSSLCRPFLFEPECQGRAKSECADYMACINGCSG
jgi:hypothetical protein